VAVAATAATANATAMVDKTIGAADEVSLKTVGIGFDFRERDLIFAFQHHRWRRTS
jgi:hypothetical protein